MTPVAARLAVRPEPCAGTAASQLDRLDDAGLDQLPTAVLALDATGRVVRCNAVAARRAGVARWQVFGRSFDRELAWLVGATAAETVRAFRAGCDVADAVAARRGGRGRGEDYRIELVRGAGGVTWLLLG